MNNLLSWVERNWLLTIVLAIILVGGCQYRCHAGVLVDAAGKVEQITTNQAVTSAVSNATEKVTSTTKKLADQSAPLMAVLARGMEKAGGYIEQAVDFTVEQAPLVVQEYATWTFVTALIWSVIWMLVVAAFWGFAILLWRVPKKHGLKIDEGWGYGEFPVYAATRGLCLVLFAISFWPMSHVGNNLQEAAKAKFAPRVLLIEKAVEIYKKQ